MSSKDRIRILFLAANPTLSEPLSLGEEEREIRQKINASGQRDRFTIERRSAVRFEDLLQVLNEYRPHVVHFSGHGVGSEGLVLHADQNRPQLVSSTALRRVFTALRDEIRLVFLNACDSEEQAAAIVASIDFVIGMSAGINDRPARAFAATFYQALGYGRSVRNAFDQGLSVLEVYDNDESTKPRLLCRDGLDPAEAYLLSKADAPESSPPPDNQNPDVVNDSGTLLLLDDNFFTDVDLREDAELLHFFVPSSDAEAEARLRALRDHRADLVYAYGNDAGRGYVQEVSSKVVSGKRTWQLVIKSEQDDWNVLEDWGYNELSADEIAVIRARRILFDEKLPSRGLDTLLEALVQGGGSRSRVEVKQSVLPAALHRLRDQSSHFALRAARLLVIAQLKLSKTIEHVHELTLGPRDETHLHVRFRGERRSLYSNEPPSTISLEGRCPV